MTRCAIVTGGNSGIGAAIVRALGAQGWDVVIDYLEHPEATDRLVEEVAAAGGRAVGVQADVSRVADLQRLVDTAVERFGRLDVMVNNAGMETRNSLLEATEEDFEKVIAVDLKSAFFGTQLAARQFIAQSSGDQGSGGLVINISSIHEDQPMPGNIAYCVAKGGVRMLARTAGVELGHHGIRVINVAPGAVDTPINAETTHTSEAQAQLHRAIPLGAMARPEQIGDLVALLCSPAASYLTATTITADGGLTQNGSSL